MPQRVDARSGLFAPPGGLLSVGVLTAALLWAWYAWIFSPSLGLERDRALAGNVVQTLTDSLRSVAYDEDRARDLVVALRRELPRIERLDGVDSGPLLVTLQRLEDALRLGTYDPTVHRAALNELRAMQLQLIARSQVTAATAAQTSLRINLMFIALLAAAIAMASAPRASGTPA